MPRLWMENGMERWSEMQDIAYPFPARAGMGMKTDGLCAAYTEPRAVSWSEQAGGWKIGRTAR
jgi:hypothetical protein